MGKSADSAELRRNVLTPDGKTDTRQRNVLTPGTEYGAEQMYSARRGFGYRG
ncbi:MAG: hypothetical protein IT343_17885 [Candidatus Melainabacteria bacterium]|nr:hypothetical protein [Candidatus Melainabacteria bacterium]